MNGLFRSRSLWLLLPALALLAGAFGAQRALSHLGGPPTLEEKLRHAEELESVPDVLDPTAVAQHIREYEQAAREARHDYIGWLAAFNASGIDPRTLEWSEALAKYLPGPATLDEAVQQADLIVSGTVEHVKFLPTPQQHESYATGYMVVHVTVEKVVKGTNSRTIAVIFGSAPQPSPRDPSNAVLVYFANEPPLLPGDDAILLLSAAENYPFYAAIHPGAYYPQSWTGVNRIEDGRVHVLGQSPLQALFQGKSRDEVLALLGQALGAN